MVVEGLPTLFKGRKTAESCREEGGGLIIIIIHDVTHDLVYGPSTHYWLVVYKRTHHNHIGKGKNGMPVSSAFSRTGLQQR